MSQLGLAEWHAWVILGAWMLVALLGVAFGVAVRTTDSQEKKRRYEKCAAVCGDFACAPVLAAVLYGLWSIGAGLKRVFMGKTWR